jgi:hypothetical protein
MPATKLAPSSLIVLGLVGAALVERNLAEIGAKGSRCLGPRRRAAFQTRRLLPLHLRQQPPELPPRLETRFIAALIT